MEIKFIEKHTERYVVILKVVQVVRLIQKYVVIQKLARHYSYIPIVHICHKEKIDGADLEIALLSIFVFFKCDLLVYNYRRLIKLTFH